MSVPVLQHRVETDEQLASFEYWFNQGAGKRTQREVAKHFGRNEETISLWKKRYDWVARAAEREGAISETVRDEVSKVVTKSLAEQKLEYLSIATAVLEQFKLDLKEGRIKLTAVDAERYIRLSLFLQGDSEGRFEVLTLDALDKAIQELEAEVARRANADAAAGAPQGLTGPLRPGTG